MHPKNMSSVELVETIRELQALTGLRPASLEWFADCLTELEYRNELSVLEW
jgi:hypothetical protein